MTHFFRTAALLHVALSAAFALITGARLYFDLSAVASALCAVAFAGCSVTMALLASSSSRADLAKAASAELELDRTWPTLPVGGQR
jgi:hypothetical protein